MRKRTMILIILGVVLLTATVTYFINMKQRADAQTAKKNEIEIAEKKDEYAMVKTKDPLVKYEGPVHHVFFHSLIAYTELAFDKDSRAEGYNYWMTTVSEFEKMLPQLLERGYMLYDIEDLIEVDPEDNKKIRKKDIYLPEGRIPLILSIDDVNYYEYMKKDGFATKLVIDKNGNVTNEIITPEGETILSRKADVMPILDDFVRDHPEFSFNGAKGIIALTGYQGAFGYRITDWVGEELEKGIADATKVANRLKETGWKLACHSYTHNQYFKKYTITMSELKYDNERWKKFIGAVTGETNIYISPFGVRFKDSDERYRYIVNEGFNIFCPVQRKPELTVYGDNVIMTRCNLDGFSMIKSKEYLDKTYFNVDEVIDKSRPKMK